MASFLFFGGKQASVISAKCFYVLASTGSNKRKESITTGFPVFYAAIFFRLCAMQINPHSISVFSMPLSKNRLKLLLNLILPNTGSTSAGLFLR
jgi:hypothetical protein